MIRGLSGGRLFPAAPASAPPPHEGPESIRRNTAFALAMRIVGAVFTGGLTLFLVRYLGPDDYGVYALAISVGGLLLLPADAGVSRSAARFIAERRGEPSQVFGVLHQAVVLKAIASALVAAALAALAAPIADAYDVPDLEWPLRIVAVALVGQSFMLLFSTTFEALGRNSLGFRLAFSESALEVSASLALVLSGAGVAGAVGGRAIGYGCAAVLGLVLALRAIGGLRLGRPPSSGFGVRRIAAYAGALFVVDAAFAAFSQIDVLMIGAFLDAESAGFFSAPAQILLFTAYLGQALAAGVAPRLAYGPGRDPDLDSFQFALRLILAVQVAFAVPFLVWAEPITDLLLGPDYAESADVFRGLTPFVVLVGPSVLLSLGINYLGEARRRVPLALAAIAINAAIDAVLIPKIGIIAGAIGTNVAYLVFVGGHVLICRRVIGLPLREPALTLLRASIAGGCMAAVLFAFGTASLSAVELIAGGILGVLAYAAGLLVTGEVGRGELDAARRMLGREHR